MAYIFTMTAEILQGWCITGMIMRFEMFFNTMCPVYCIKGGLYTRNRPPVYIVFTAVDIWV